VGISCLYFTYRLTEYFSHRHAAELSVLAAGMPSVQSVSPGKIFSTKDIK